MEATFLDQNVPSENEPFDFLRLFCTFDRSARVSLNPNQIIILRTINLARKSSKNDSDGESARSQNSVTAIRTIVIQNTKCDVQESQLVRVSEKCPKPGQAGAWLRRCVVTSLQWVSVTFTQDASTYFRYAVSVFSVEERGEKVLGLCLPQP